MSKCKDLSEFDKGQIVIARQLGQSISKTAALVGCSRSAVVSIYQKWSKEGTVMNRRQGHGRPRLIDACGERRLACVVRSNRRATVAQIAQEPRSFANSASASQSFSFLFGSTRTKRWLRQLQGTAEPERDKRTKTNRAEEEEGGREDDDEEEEEEGEKVVRNQGDPELHRIISCQNLEKGNQATL
ncbi:hypothetical protein DPX16_10611 [Anabarilius grahami]|uniref:Tc3 transposase DNA binding domain-containing protein n=1 Tax=Anabarilius grahami TaxID=495550 RepID=A0A3N0Z8B4_ANAGA|nr:hypothetical protein DPX16_10611 [Anabarilius grahami]